ncbi:MAG: hypothetical protein ACXVAS_03630 [Vulcanimicrobiaceae bacterium]
MPALREAVSSLSQQSLIGIQAFRLLGVLFIIALLRGQLPPIFALPAGIGDILIGATALEVAYLFKNRVARAHGAALVWNIGGILDLVIAVSIGFFASTAAMRAIYSTPSTDLITVLPLVMVPAFGVPLFILLHIASLQALARDRSSRRATPTPSTVAYPATPPDRSSA